MLHLEYNLLLKEREIIIRPQHHAEEACMQYLLCT